jgi:hypothetical protein
LGIGDWGIQEGFFLTLLVSSHFPTFFLGSHPLIDVQIFPLFPFYSIWGFFSIGFSELPQFCTIKNSKLLFAINALSSIEVDSPLLFH